MESPEQIQGFQGPPRFSFNLLAGDISQKSANSENFSVIGRPENGLQVDFDVKSEGPLGTDKWTRNGLITQDVRQRESQELHTRPNYIEDRSSENDKQQNRPNLS